MIISIDVDAEKHLTESNTHNKNSADEESGGIQ